MRPEWKDRVRHWINVLKKEFYEPLGEISLEYFTTDEMLTPEQAEERTFAPAPRGMAWGRTWEYGWFRGDICLDARAQGLPVVMDILTGGEATVFVNGRVFGTRRAEWVKERHHYICDQVLSGSGRAGESFHLLLEAYAGHDFRSNTGPVREGDFEPLPPHATRQVTGPTTYGLWHEDAYQLYLDVSALNDMLTVLDETSLRAAEVEAALEQFTLMVDFEQPRDKRLEDYRRARRALRPVMEARNGSTMPEMWAMGNAHLDLSWLWPYRETQRKVARTFAQQVRLMDMYPDYCFIQSQPQSYLICKEMYPELYRQVKEKVRKGQWIADGSMWVEPDTNMTSGESLIRQVVYGKRFYREEFGVEARLLWLPDTFGYSAALPQILKNCGVEYLTTQKIFWTYNGSDKFPYHYFTWQGMDGTEITSFLHMDYTSATDAATVHGRWRDRVQKRGLKRFLLPFGYGDGGGGPCRDHIENVRRLRDLEGIPRVRMDTPQAFFDACARDGAPANKYVGELYFQCHRGTYTSQAAVKRGNRKTELALREAELWSAAAQGKVPYPAAQLESCWKDVLLNQFHDILPGSSIARVYEEAARRYARVLEETESITGKAVAAQTCGRGQSWFNALSWQRRALVKTDAGYGYVTLPPMGWSSRVDTSLPDMPVHVEPCGQGAVLRNGKLTVHVNARGEITALQDEKGRSRISGPANVLHMYKDVPRLYDAWDIDSMYHLSPVELDGESHVQVIQDTPWRCALRVERKISSSVWTQEIALEAGQTRVDFITHVDWHEKHRLLKAAFPTGIHADEGLNEIQFGYVRRPTHRSRPYDADRFEVCNHRYTALCDESHGAAVLNDCKYGVSMLGDEIALTLLRASTAPDLHADQGGHDFAYSYYLWDGSLLDSDVVRQGYELNVPVRQAEGRAETFSLMEVDAPNVIIDTVKAAEDGTGDVILRLYECKHAPTDAALTLHMPFAAAALCDMLENETEPLEPQGSTLQLHFRGFEVKTIRLKQ